MKAKEEITWGGISVDKGKIDSYRRIKIKEGREMEGEEGLREEERKGLEEKGKQKRTK